MTLDLNKPVRTRGGMSARIICTDRNGDRPIVALLGDNHEIMAYYPGGSFYPNHSECVHDLVNVPAFDPTKPVQTRDGRRARIMCVDRFCPLESHYPILALVMDHAGEEEYPEAYTLGGRHYNESEETGDDLVNI